MFAKLDEAKEKAQAVINGYEDRKAAILHKAFVIPYLNRDYDSSLYDGTTYPPLEENPKRFAITKRNEWMVEQADVVVAYVKHDWGGAAAAVASRFFCHSRLLI